MPGRVPVIFDAHGGTSTRGATHPVIMISSVNFLHVSSLSSPFLKSVQTLPKNAKNRMTDSTITMQNVYPRWM